MRKKYPFYDNEPINSIVELLKRSCRIYGDSVAVKYKRKKKICAKTYNDLLFDSKNIAQHLLNQNLEKGHIAILGSSSYEYIASYLGIVFAGFVVVPIDKELSAIEIAEQIKQSDTEFLIYDEKNAHIVNTLKEQFDVNISFLNMGKSLDNDIKQITLPAVNPDKLSTIIFTSGTTGKSKGVMLTQKNIASNVLQGLGAVNLKHNKDVIFSVLPMNHAYEFTCTVLGMIYAGVPICISSGLRYIQKEFQEYQPTVMFVVPLFAETLYKNVEFNIKKQNKEKAFKKAVQINNILKKLHINLSDIFFKKIKKAFGGNLNVIMCGGSQLSENLIIKYNEIGINLFQGYGLTECSPLLTVNFDYYHRANSVGKVVQGNNVKIVDGEIWAKGISVSAGYYNAPEENAKSFENGWFKTGDLGSIDEDGFVYITGRKKNLIILDNGKNVSAEEIENYIYEIPYISETIVYGENNCIVAEIYIDPENKCEHNVEEDINIINNKLASYKRIDKIVVRDKPFEKTATKKIKRY